MEDVRNGTGRATPSGAGTVLLLVRHAHTDAIGRVLTGRAAGVPLSSTGRAQAEHLGRALAPLPLAAIYTSPLERTLETARALARHQSAALHEDPELLEADFGAWTGLSFAELETRADWRAFNTHRGSAAVPEGETAADVQRRIVGAIERLAARHAGRTIVAVSHADVIRAAVLHIAATPLDLYDRFEISPASVTAVAFDGKRRRLLYVNNIFLGGTTP